MSNEIDIKNKIKANSSLFTNFVKNAVNASPKVQNNFLDVSAQVALTIQKILEDADLITNLEYKGKNFYIADIETDGINTASAAGIRGVPTVIIYKKGTETNRIVGGVPEGKMKEFLDENI